MQNRENKILYNFRFFLFTIWTVLLLVGLAACSVSSGINPENISSEPQQENSAIPESTPAPTPDPEPLQFDCTKVKLCVGETWMLRTHVLPESAEKVQFVIGDPAIAAVQGKRLVAKSVGKTTVTAILNDQEVTCQVTVKPAPETLTISRHNTSVFSGESVKLVCQTDRIGLEPLTVKTASHASVNIGEWKATESGSYEAELEIIGLSAGTDIITVTTYNGLMEQCTVRVAEKTDAAELENFQAIYQWPELPTGCEVTAATMAMRYLGFEIGKTELADEYLPFTYHFRADVRYLFLGHPSDPKSAGCYAPCIVTTVENYLDAKGLHEEWEVLDLTGSDPQVLYDYVAKGTPVIVWVTSSMQEPYVNFWCVAEDGTQIPWMFPEHCAVLMGYDKKNELVRIADSEYGSICTWDMSLFEQIYDMMLSQAIVLLPK